jgi:hypothetical protein
MPIPTDIAGCIWWLKADSLALADGATFTQWNDSSPSGWHVHPTNIPPVFHTNVINGKPAILFNKSNQNALGTLNPVAFNQPDSFFIVAKRTSNGATGAVLWDTYQAGTRQLIYFDTSGNIVVGTSTGTSLTLPFDGSAFHIYNAVYNGASSFFYIDNVQRGSGNFGTDNISNYLVIGALTDLVTYKFDGYIAEFILYNSALSATDRQSVVDYLNAKYFPPPPTIQPTTGAYVLTGEPAAFPRARIFSISSGIYALAGQATSFVRAKGMTLAQGAYTLTGAALASVSGQYVKLVSGIYKLAGVDVGLKENRVYLETGKYDVVGGWLSASRSARPVVPKPPIPAPGTTLRTGHLLDLCAPSFNFDAQVQSGCFAFDQQMYEIIDDTGQVIFIPSIMSLTDSKLVDILAWQFHVDFYDTTRDLTFRKNLVQMSIEWHRTKGTKHLVESVINTYWPNGGATLKEWFEYLDPTIEIAFYMNFRAADVNVPQNRFNLNAHGLLLDDVITFDAGAGGTLPAPIVADQFYAVVNAQANSFQISTLIAGPPLVITDAGVGTANIINKKLPTSWPPNYPNPGWHDRYRFRVVVDEEQIPPEDEQAVLALIDRYKPISRWCDGIVRPISSTCMIGWCGMSLRFISKESAKPINYP